MRGKDVSRIEGFSDAVFGFSLTLLVVSTAVPESFADLRRTLEGFPAFAVTFAVICWIWYEHYAFFRRFDLRDSLTVFLNSLLLFVVMFFVYPLKFVFTRLIGGTILGVGPAISDGLTPADARMLMLVYSSGWVAVFVIFALLHWNAFRRRNDLALAPLETYDAKAGARAHLLSVAVGVTSLLLATLLPIQYLAFSGLVFFVMGPLHGANGYWNARRRARVKAAR
jgi:uncharacterized membrane protein